MKWQQQQKKESGNTVGQDITRDRRRWKIAREVTIYIIPTDGPGKVKLSDMSIHYARNA